MKCVKCGAELKEGCLYCSRCGQEVQMVTPSYSVLEDEYLHALLHEKEEEPLHKKEPLHQKGEQQQTSVSKKGKAPSAEAKKKISSKTPIIVVCVLLVVLICGGIGAKLVIDYKNAHSYDYQVKMAKREAKYGNEETALEYYKTALSLKPDDIDARMAMADIYIEQKDSDAAAAVLLEVVERDKKNMAAYRSLISIYEEKEDFASITEMAADITELEIQKLFDVYLVSEPIISPAQGTYEEYISASIFSPEDFDIYYTLDGTKPDAEHGILYNNTKKIPLEKAGKYEIRAVCRNKKGIYSSVAKSSFVIKITAPDYATVSPDGGRITAETGVFITAQAGCDIYYTWDGSDPTTQSEKYTTPLAIPTGNNVLSVLVVDRKTGLDSGVYRTNFIYYP